jgi:AraC-like DNA-binding protein
MFVADKFILRQYYFLADGTDRDFDTWYQFTGFLSMLLYFAASLRYYSLYQKIIVQLTSNAEDVLFRWVKNFLFAFLSMQILQVFFYFLMKVIHFQNQYMGSWWYFFSFSLIFYYIAIRGYANSIEAKVRFKLNLLENKEGILLEEGEDENEETSSIIKEEIIEIETFAAQTNEVENALILEWKPKILYLLEIEKVYENPELSLTQVAKSLRTNPSLISKVVNQGFQQNFNDFVNFYRIEAIKQKIAQGEHQKQTLLGIAYTCGFNSKATFNRAFKKITGYAPKDYIASKN